MRYLLLSLLFVACTEPFEIDSTSIFENELAELPQQESGNSEIICSFNPETMPQYPGGIQAFYSFFQKNFKYPLTKPCVEGKAFVQLIIEKDGSVMEIKIVKGIEMAYDEEVIRVLNLMPGWKPGAINGNPCRMKMMMPITFR